MFKDLKRTIRVMKASKLRREFHAKQIYHDGFEQMNEMLHPEYQMLKIVKIEKLSHNVTLLRGVSARVNKGLAPFRAGQYIGVKPIIDGIRTGRAYSLVSSPNNLAYYEIAVKDLGSEGFVSHFLCNEVEVGDLLEVTEPLGQFYYSSIFHGKRLLFLAGGCGVTPFISMLRDFYEKDTQFDVHMIYGCLTEKDILFYDELKKMAEEKPNIDLTIVLSEVDKVKGNSWTGKRGFITKEIIRDAMGTLDNTMIYIVGPDLMRDFLIKELDVFDLPQNKVIWEITPPIADITKAIGWPNEITDTTKVKCTVNWHYLGNEHRETLEIRSAEPLLNSIERAKLEGVVVNNACRAGECALCRTRLLSGNVFVPSHIHIRESDRIWGY
ncbi:MAG: hypothetical protein GF364_01385, partial [Candidatus Lokiarchaeota archaeon]|nr:hypothetical protein [Candidatus Lokiarchaeota archaeon]